MTIDDLEAIAAYHRRAASILLNPHADRLMIEDAARHIKWAIGVEDYIRCYMKTCAEVDAVILAAMKGAIHE